VIDVASQESVRAAAKTVSDKFGTSEALYAIVNNAGTMFTDGPDFSGELKTTLDVNMYGVVSVCDAFIPLIQKDKGRVVMTSSAGGCIGISKISDDAVKQMLISETVTWKDVCESFLNPCMKLAREGGREKLAEARLTVVADNIFSSYFISKAALNAYTTYLGKTHTNLVINGFTPGFIETDLTAHFRERSGRSGSEMGMQGPEEGAKPAMYLLFAEATADFAKIPVSMRPAKNVLPHDPTKGINGRYYGSDGVRSPLDVYRGFGGPPYGD